jgi:sigma-B regulation protein RsbU (phosphoserine phosphatase)
MTSISLSRLVDRNPELQEALNGILSQMGPHASIRDYTGNVLAGSNTGSDSTRYPISQNGEIIGWVADGINAKPVSLLIEYFARQEEEKRSLGAEMIDRYRELNLLYHLSERLAEAPHPESIIRAALEEALRLNKAKAGLFLTVSEEQSSPQIAAVQGFQYTSILKGDLLDRVIQTRKADIDNEAHGEDYFLEEKGEILSLACAPLKTEKRVIGLIVLVRDQGNTFSAGAIKLLNSIAMQIAPALEIIRLYQVAVEKERIERELLMARQVQQSLLPAEMPQIQGWDFARRWRPAREVSGDFYDFIFEGPDQLGLVIADVTDKGMPAALFMVFARSALRASLGQIHTPAEAITVANNLICRDSFEGLFATLFYARLMTDSGQLTYVNAGHNPPLLYRSLQDEIQLLKRTGLPLGVVENSDYEECSVVLQPGDFILFYTDGITEAVNSAGVEFGPERLQRVIYELKACSTDEIISGLENALNEYADPSQSFDDITMMAVRRM